MYLVQTVRCRCHMQLQMTHVLMFNYYRYKPNVTRPYPGSVVGIATAYGLDSPGIESRWGRDFPHLSIPGLRPTQPPVQRVPGLSRG